MMVPSPLVLVALSLVSFFFAAVGLDGLGDDGFGPSWWVEPTAIVQ